MADDEIWSLILKLLEVVPEAFHVTKSILDVRLTTYCVSKFWAGNRTSSHRRNLWQILLNRKNYHTNDYYIFQWYILMMIHKYLNHFVTLSCHKNFHLLYYIHVNTSCMVVNVIWKHYTWMIAFDVTDWVAYWNIIKAGNY